MIPIIREIHSELLTEAAYEIYSACMYRPTPEKYRALMDEYLSDPDVRCFGAFPEDQLAGVLIVHDCEILGIAVHAAFRGRNIGRTMIAYALRIFPVLIAETDSDAVGFYRRCDFECTAFERVFPDGSCIRYECKKHA